VTFQAGIDELPDGVFVANPAAPNVAYLI